MLMLDGSEGAPMKGDRFLQGYLVLVLVGGLLLQRAIRHEAEWFAWLLGLPAAVAWIGSPMVGRELWERVHHMSAEIGPQWPKHLWSLATVLVVSAALGLLAVL
jgi:hypothetical protein